MSPQPPLGELLGGGCPLTSNYVRLPKSSHSPLERLCSPSTPSAKPRRRVAHASNQCGVPRLMALRRILNAEPGWLHIPRLTQDGTVAKPYRQGENMHARFGLARGCAAARLDRARTGGRRRRTTVLARRSCAEAPPGAPGSRPGGRGGAGRQRRHNGPGGWLSHVEAKAFGSLGVRVAAFKSASVDNKAIPLCADDQCLTIHPYAQDNTSGGPASPLTSRPIQVGVRIPSSTPHLFVLAPRLGRLLYTSELAVEILDDPHYCLEAGQTQLGHPTWRFLGDFLDVRPIASCICIAPPSHRSWTRRFRFSYAITYASTRWGG